MALQEITEDKKFYDAMQVSETTEDWTVIVQVVVKRKAEVAKKNPSKLKKYILTDMQGTKIPAVTFNNNIEPLDKLLTPFKRYQISNADLNLVEPLYRIGEYPYEWILTTNHMIEEIHDDIPYTIPCTFSLARFSELSPYAERNEFINVKGLVIGSIPVHGFGDPVRDYILINEEKMPVVLRLWDNFLDNDEVNISARLPEPTLIIGLTLRVTTYHGISLATAMYNTYFLVDPPLSDASSIHEWYINHRKEITELLTNQAYDDVDRLLPPPKEWFFRRIKDVTNNVNEFKAAWVTGTLQLMPAHDKLWQPICSTCKKYFKGKVNWAFTCTNCKKKSKIIPRGRLEVYLSDPSGGTMSATIFTPHVEKITGMTAAQLHEADVKGQSLIKEVDEAINGKKVFCFVRFFKAETNHIVVQLYTENDLERSRTGQLQAVHPHSMMNTPEQAPKERSKFFTPSIEAALDEITASSSSKSPTHDSSPPSKRTLMFGSITTMLPESSPAKVTTSVAPSPQKHGTESPIKKSKNKGEDQGQAS